MISNASREVSRKQSTLSLIITVIAGTSNEQGKQYYHQKISDFPAFPSELFKRIDQLQSFCTLLYTMSQKFKKFQGDGFIIEDCIIKGDKKYYDVKENNIGELIFKTLSETPEHIGQIDASTGKRKTFAEIKKKSTALAAWLRKEAVGPGDIVSLCSPRHPDAEIIFCAISFVGAIYTPLVHNADLAVARHYINITQPRVIFTHKSMIDTLQQAATLENHKWKIIVIDSDLDCDYKLLDDLLKLSSLKETKNFQVSKVDPDNPCVIFHTSGTTGIPKFIPLSHKQFIYQVFQFDVIGKAKKPNNILLTYFYPGWVLQMLVSTRSILLRQTLVFHKAFEPHETCKIIEQYKVDTLIWDVYMISLLAESDVTMNKYDLTPVTCMHSVGSKLFDEVRGKVLEMFPNVHAIGRGLGIIETGLLTLFTDKCRNPKSEGTVVPDVQLKIVDTKTGVPLEHNKNGELCAKSPCMMTGYYKNPTASKLAFDDDGWYRSGDEAYYDENGEIVVVGRLKEMIKYRETELQPLCLEQTLLSHPNIIDAAVVGIYHEVEIEQPVAYVQVAPGSCVTEDDILMLTNDLEYSDIFKGRVIFTDNIPRNTNGKIDRRYLREHAESYYKSQ